MISADAKRRVRRACKRQLSGHPQLAPADEFARLAAWSREDGRGIDAYGKGELIEAFEAKIAALVGKESAVFMPSGTMAQQIALRIWADAAGTDKVGLHVTSHLEIHEQRGYAHLHGLVATLIGEAHRPIIAKDLEACAERLAAVITELPIREVGGLLPTWDELETLKAVAARKGVKLHMDGARLWESQDFYAPRSHAEICAGFDSVYVSFYKGIGALSGAVLAGSKDFVAESRIWQRRHGGNLWQLHPYVAAAAMRFDERLAQMPTFAKRARQLATAIAQAGVGVVAPTVPHTSMFHLSLRGDAQALDAAHLAQAEKSGLWLTSYFKPASVPGWATFEVSIGENAMTLTDDEICATLRVLTTKD